jgi:hypothetical protein
MSKFRDLAGQRFGCLTAAACERRCNAAGRSVIYWPCGCVCGNETVVRASNLRSGGTQSCGCRQRERAHAAQFRHGESGARSSGRRAKPTSEYSTWKGMLRRCEDVNNPDYKNYGGRGITVCERWHDYRNFLTDMGRCPPDLALERINNDLGYGPSNCKWATYKEQNNNKRVRTWGTWAKKLSDYEVRRIRLDPRFHRVIAQDYGVTRRVICAVKRRRTYSHIP